MRSGLATAARCVLLAALVAGCQGSSNTFTRDAVPMPTDVHPVATLKEPVGTVTLLVDDDGCMRTLVTVGKRRDVDAADRCPVDPSHAFVVQRPAEVSFNDRRRTGTRCPDLCAPALVDAQLTGMVLYGHVGPTVVTVCVPNGDDPLVVRPDEHGYVLASLGPGRHVHPFGALLVGAHGWVRNPDAEQIPSEWLASCQARVPASAVPRTGPF